MSCTHLREGVGCQVSGVGVPDADPRSLIPDSQGDWPAAVVEATGDRGPETGLPSSVPRRSAWRSLRLCGSIPDSGTQPGNRYRNQTQRHKAGNRTDAEH